MTEKSHELTEISPSRPADTKQKTALKRFWKFPKSWREVRSLGWKFVVAFVLFYLIRDTILYIIIPYLVYKGVISL